MPQWVSNRLSLKEKIEQELAKNREIREQAKSTVLETPIQTSEWVPTSTWQAPQSQVAEIPTLETPTRKQAIVPTQVRRTVEPQKIVTPIETIKKESTIAKPKTEVAEQIPFWQRAMKVFAAPFDWIDNTLIKPALGIALDVAVPDTIRKEGEDYFTWKRRSWDEWNAPGLTFDMPWGKWKLDVKGVAEFAPWLLIPGAGQVGGAIRGVATTAKAGSFLAKVAPALKFAGKAIQYSPWGLVEKGTGAVIKTALKPLSSAVEKKGVELSAKMYGSIPKQVATPAEQNFAKVLKETVIPSFNKFEKIGKKELRERQAKGAAKVLKEYNAGKLTYTQFQTELAKSRSGGAKEYYAVTPQALAQRKADDIAQVQARVQSGQIDAATGKGMITRINNSPEYMAPNISQTDVKELLDTAARSAEKGIFAPQETIDATTALRDLLTLGLQPEPRHFDMWAKIYGKDVAESLGALSKQPLTKLEKVLDLLNLPRATLASVDLSGTLRQGAILTVSHPIVAAKSFGKQLKAMASEKLTLTMDDLARQDPDFSKFIQDGGFWADIRKTAATGLGNMREEAFSSKIAERMPFVRRSERAYVTYLNELRLGTYKALKNNMIASGATEQEMKQLARFVNLASGRGDLPYEIDKYAPLLNSVFFSTRKQLATLQMPKMLGSMLLSKNPYMRKEGARALATFFGGGTALLGLMKAAGVADIETDPRSADFGKIKFKNSETRLDIWTGYLQYIRFIARMMTGESKSAYGNISKAERLKIASSFLQSKTAPAIGLLVDLLAGQTYDGEPVFSDTKGTLTGAGKRVTPLIIQDLIDAFEQNGANGLAQAAPAVLGVGVLTYVNKFNKLKNQLAQQNGKENWDELDPLTQRRLEKLPEFQAAALQFDRDVMGTAWGDWHNAGNIIEENFKNEVQLASNKYDTDKDGISFRKKISDAYNARRGAYDARNKEDRFAEISSRLEADSEQESFVKLGVEQFAIKTYMDALYGKDMTDEFGDYKFGEAEARKAMLRQYLDNMQPGLFDYVEEYLGMKYDDFPPIFQELKQAQTVLKPYWSVKDEVYRLYGEPKNAYQLSRLNSLISKIRKRMRATDRNISKYYDMFYKDQETI